MQHDMTRAGLPHSEIPGSILVLRSPRLIAEFYVLHRYWLSRHPLSVPLCTFLCIDWIGSWIFNSKVNLSTYRQSYILVEKDIRYCPCICINKYLNEITNINLIILRLKHKLLNYCACHTWQSVAWLYQDYINHRSMTSRTVVVECTFETSLYTWNLYLHSTARFIIANFV